jgi:hypothetical protein
MGEGSGKALGGTVVGAGGALALALKATTAPVHVAEVGLRSAAIGGEAVQVGANGLRTGARVGTAAGSEIRFAGGAVGAHMLAEGALPLERTAATHLSDLPIRSFELEGHAISGAKLAPTATKRTKALAPSHAIHDALEHADTAVDVLQNLLDVWDFVSPTGDDEDDLRNKFNAAGVDFRGDVVPGVRGEAFAGIVGARRALFSNGDTLVSGIRFASAPPMSELDATQRADLASRRIAGLDGNCPLYVEQPLRLPALEQWKGSALIRSLGRSSSVEWRAIALPASTPSMRLPGIIEIEGRRYAALARLPGETYETPAEFVVIQRK